MTAAEPERYSGEYAWRLDLQRRDEAIEPFWYGSEGFPPAAAVLSPFVDPVEFVSVEDWLAAALDAAQRAQQRPKQS
ncbi:hypothetical protein KIH27_02085 [Mycobacterium sp. M1]|uniref:Uncharacterized protein n=1 Tax=Mycolicibacter acidiphilus TaxID=2835306 RepID=A0ABS5RFC5_9MYCO|nr:hypothetical protein [Mycolicibacter acidiphilus]MBS9532374.1 hypothetical protein [Mycolicibacter acidiphilus]